MAIGDRTGLGSAMNAAQANTLGGSRAPTASELAEVRRQYEEMHARQQMQQQEQQIRAQMQYGAAMNNMGSQQAANHHPSSAPETIVSSMTARKIANGIVMNIRFAAGAKEIFVESVDKLGEALVQAIVENRIES